MVNTPFKFVSLDQPATVTQVIHTSPCSVLSDSGTYPRNSLIVPTPAYTQSRRGNLVLKYPHGNWSSYFLECSDSRLQKQNIRLVLVGWYNYSSYSSSLLHFRSDYHWNICCCGSSSFGIARIEATPSGTSRDQWQRYHCGWYFVPISIVRVFLDPPQRTTNQAPDKIT